MIADDQVRGVDEPWQGGGFLDNIVRLQRSPARMWSLSSTTA
ncbi:MAG: hypothetical protein ACRDRR_18080 [Pseudonocardiaceae bacterium]